MNSPVGLVHTLSVYPKWTKPISIDSDIYAYEEKLTSAFLFASVFLMIKCMLCLVV